MYDTAVQNHHRFTKIPMGPGSNKKNTPTTLETTTTTTTLDD